MGEVVPADKAELSLFVAMPYTDMGQFAPIKKPAEVERFYEQVRAKIAGAIERPVRMRIEKYSRETGLVIDGMFRAIADADVFIADLTGWNVNVALELGIRFGVSQKVTIITSQEDRSLPFDLNQMRFVRYANRVSQAAEEEIADVVKSALNDRGSGSPILKILDLEVVPRALWEVLSGSRVKVLLQHSKTAGHGESQLEYVRQAIEIDPFSLVARIELARILRTLERFDDAVVAVESALRVFPQAPELHKELGTIFDRMSARELDPAGLLDRAAEAYLLAISQGTCDADLHCCYGGVLRRKAFATSAREREVLFSESLHQYQTAVNIDRHSTYAGLNVTRLMLLLAVNSETTKAQLQRMFHLCAFEVEDSKLRHANERWWRMFDLADIFAMMSETDRSLGTYETAIGEIPRQQKKDVLLSPKRTWEEFLRAGIMEKEAERILGLLNTSHEMEPLTQSCTNSESVSGDP